MMPAAFGRVLFWFRYANKDCYFAVKLLKYPPSKSSTYLPITGRL